MSAPEEGPPDSGNPNDVPATVSEETTPEPKVELAGPPAVSAVEPPVEQAAPASTPAASPAAASTPTPASSPAAIIAERQKTLEELSKSLIADIKGLEAKASMKIPAAPPAVDAASTAPAAAAAPPAALNFPPAPTIAVAEPAAADAPARELSSAATAEPTAEPAAPPAAADAATAGPAASEPPVAAAAPVIAEPPVPSVPEPDPAEEAADPAAATSAPAAEYEGEDGAEAPEEGDDASVEPSDETQSTASAASSKRRLLEKAKEKLATVKGGVASGVASVWGKGRGQIQRVRNKVGEMAWRGSARQTLEMRQEEWATMKVQGAEEVLIPARSERTCAFHVEKGAMLRWTFRVKDHDIGFGVRMRVQQWGGSREDEVLAVERFDNKDTISGSWVADEDRTMILAFDNRYSKLRKKTVAYIVGTEKPPAVEESPVDEVPYEQQPPAEEPAAAAATEPVGMDSKAIV